VDIPGFACRDSEKPQSLRRQAESLTYKLQTPSATYTLLSLPFDPDVGGSVFLRNVVKLIRGYTMSYRRIPLREP
jgi:hypothetical protein